MFVGIDGGGTNLKAGLVDDEGRLIAAAEKENGRGQAA